MDGRLAGFDHRLEEGVGGFVKNKAEADVEAGNAQVVLHHIHLHHVFARAGIAYRGKGVHYLFGV